MPRVVIIGGGVAGMSAAQELAERGYEVVVLERHHRAGGKARSIEVTRSRLGPNPMRYNPADPGIPWVPGEHGFRFFPGFYKNVIDTMARIPLTNGKTVADDLVPTTRIGITQYGRPAFDLPARFPRFEDAGVSLRAVASALGPVTGLRPDDLIHFGEKIWQILTSCPERRLAEYEKIPWWAFIDADSRSAAYQKFLAHGITRSLVAAKADKASTRTIGDIFAQLLLTVLDPTAGSTDRVLNGPTTDVWLRPWRELLVSKGVEYRTHFVVKGLCCDAGAVTGIIAEHEGVPEMFTGDHYILAVPIERAAPLMTPEVVRLAPELESLHELADDVDWMNGIQFYLARDVPMTRGHVIHVDTEWALTSISQAQFWAAGTLDVYGDVDVNGIISVDVSDWEAPGLSGRTARECSRAEVESEVWRQLKKSVNGSGYSELRDEDLLGWFLDPDIRPDPEDPGQLLNTEALLVNLADTWRLRPEATTAIPNLFLASDYVRTNTDLATMEGANEAARRAVNGILDRDDYSGACCRIWPLEEPPILAPWREYDAARFRLGLPWDATVINVASSALAVAAPAIEAIGRLLGETQVPHLDEATSAVGTSAALFRSGIRSVETLPDGDAGPPGFLDRLAWYREQIAETLGEIIPAKEPTHYLYGLIEDFMSRPSKGLRPALCLAACRAYGGRLEDAVPSAAGIEMLHNAFLVHDDVEDGSLLRSGRATLHRQVGVPLAVNAGDAMNSLSARLFHRNLSVLPVETAKKIYDEVDHLISETLEGQAMELGWARDNNCDVTVDDYLRMVLKKTAWYSFIHPMRIGALIATTGDDVDRFNRLGFLLGAAFQIQDDVLNLIGTSSRYGKEIGGDLAEGKRTLVLTHAFGSAGPRQRSQLEAFLAGPGRPRLPRQVLDVYDVLSDLGSIEWARNSAAALANAARSELPVAFRGVDDGLDMQFIRSLVSYVIERDL
jgi:geranylgeranyl pyrophosphate synthase/uncharacterized protein with NAD-binding domain and iron-sulfur cluster